MKRPYLYMTPAANNPNYQHGNLVSILGALHALYVVSVDIKFFYVVWEMVPYSNSFLQNFRSL